MMYIKIHKEKIHIYMKIPLLSFICNAVLAKSKIMFSSMVHSH